LENVNIWAHFTAILAATKTTRPEARPIGGFYSQKFLSNFFQKVGRRRPRGRQDGLKGSFRCSLAHPAVDRFGLDRTGGIHVRIVTLDARPVRGSYLRGQAKF